MYVCVCMSMYVCVCVCVCVSVRVGGIVHCINVSVTCTAMYQQWHHQHMEVGTTPSPE